MTEIKTLNVRAVFNHLEGLDRREPTTPEAELNSCFGPTVAYRDGMISTVKFSGISAWERHPADEILLVVAGSGYLLVGLDENPSRGLPQSLSKDLAVIVPANCWHQIEAPDGISLLTITPQPTDHARRWSL